MSEKIFRDYDQTGLDAEYDNRSKVSDAQAILRRFAEQSRELRRQQACELDISYGPGVDELLDVFPAPAGAVGPGPVQVFIHGGYWKALSKDEFSYVARAFTPNGCATVVINYGLIPSVDMGELVHQCRAALAWTYRNAAAFNGDPERLFISGHSAGGHLVAMMMATDWPAFDSQLPALPANLVKGGCGISGLYDLEPIRLCFLNADLRLSPDDVIANSPVRLAPKGSGPLLLTVGGNEGPEYLRQSEDLAAAWRAHGAVVDVAVLPGQDHFSIVDQLSDPGTELSRLILAQMGR